MFFFLSFFFVLTGYSISVCYIQFILLSFTSGTSNSIKQSAQMMEFAHLCKFKLKAPETPCIWNLTLLKKKIKW